MAKNLVKSYAAARVATDNRGDFRHAQRARQRLLLRFDMQKTMKAFQRQKADMFLRFHSWSDAV
jgi:hypothetical protein